jgi:hypothetical protein
MTQNIELSSWDTCIGQTGCSADTWAKRQGRVIREAPETHPNNIDSDGGFCLSKSRKYLVYALRKHRKPFS